MLNLKIGNDCGNAEIKMQLEENVIIKEPNVYVKVSELPNMDMVNPVFAFNNIYENLIVSIESDSLNRGAATTYYVGKYAMSSGERLKNIDVGVENAKVKSDAPVISTLTMIAAYSIKKEVKDIENEKIDPVVVTVDMTTALPVNQYSKENVKEYASKFRGNHIVTMFFGTKKIKVNINFDFVNVLPEGVSTVFYLQNQNIEEFKGCDFSNATILHASIGEGTTEYPLTMNGTRFNPQFIYGDTCGVGIAVEEVLEKFMKEALLSKFTRQDFMKAVKNPENKYHEEAKDILKHPLEEQAILIAKQIKKQLERANFEADYVLVYGGGSILMRNFLEPELEEFTKKRKIRLLYVPASKAVTIEVEGLYKFVTGKTFEALKNSAK